MPALQSRLAKPPIYTVYDLPFCRESASFIQLCESGPSGTRHGRSMNSFRCSRKTRSSCWSTCARGRARSVIRIQQGCAGGIADCARNPLRHFPELGGKRKSKPDSATLRGATPRSAATPITWRPSNSKKESATARCCRGSRPDRYHVRRSSLVALPSLADCGLPQSAGVEVLTFSAQTK